MILSSKVRVLVVDDSAFMRKIVSKILEKDPSIEVIATAKNGIEAIEKTLTMQPDVVIMDIQMPKMDGLTALKEIMRRRPTPIIMFSAFAKRDVEITLKALEYGAIDLVTKPYGPISLDISSVAKELIEKVKVASRARLLKRYIKPSVAQHFLPKVELRGRPLIGIAIAASTGGPSALMEVVPKIPRGLPVSVFIVQHMPPFFTKVLAEHLDSRSEIKVKEAEDGEPVLPGVAYVAPGDYHIKIIKNNESIRIRLFKGPKIHGVRPSADPLMISVAEVFKRNSIGVILTGIGNDGAAGMRAIKYRKGTTIAQNKETCVVFGMPKAAIELGVVDKVLPLWEIGDEVVRAIKFKLAIIRGSLKKRRLLN